MEKLASYRNYSDELAHHGVKGMKWGHRKDKKLGYVVKKTAKKITTKAKNKIVDYKNKQEVKREAKRENELLKKNKKKKIKDMTPEELKNEISKLELQKQYVDLQRDISSKTVNAGKKFAKEVFVGAAKPMATQLVYYLGSQAINNAARNSGWKNVKVEKRDDDGKIVYKDGLPELIDTFEDLINQNKLKQPKK